MIELVVLRDLWAHEVDENGQPVLSGEAKPRPVESRSVYNTVREALLQAAHNEVLEPGTSQRIDQNGNEFLGKQAIKEAAKKLRGHREEKGLMVNGVQVFLSEYDSKAELKVVGK